MGKTVAMGRKPGSGGGRNVKTARNELIMRLHGEGWDCQKIANELGISRQRAHQIVLFLSKKRKAIDEGGGI